MSYAVANPGGGVTTEHPPLTCLNLDGCLFKIQFCIRMIQNIGSDSMIIMKEHCVKTIKLPETLSGGALDPNRKGLCDSRSWCALRAHESLRPLYLKILDPPLLHGSCWRGFYVNVWPRGGIFLPFYGCHFQTFRVLKDTHSTRCRNDAYKLLKKSLKSEFDRLWLPSLCNNRCMFDTIRKTI